MGQSSYVHLENVDVVAETDRAFLIEYDGERHWVPRSQVCDEEDYAKDDKGVTMSITEWMANKLGIEGSD